MIRTRVGYAGGLLENPTYHNLGGHAETVEVEYDPAVITYSRLLEIFWHNHSPTERRPRQYASIIFCHSPEQEALALAALQRLQAVAKAKIRTEVVPAGSFYPAEAYHQKYYLQRVPELVREFSAIYPVFDDFVNSTAAARVNGYAAGLGTEESLRRVIGCLGLSPGAVKKMFELVQEKNCP